MHRLRRLSEFGEKDGKVGYLEGYIRLTVSLLITVSRVTPLRLAGLIIGIVRWTIGALCARSTRAPRGQYKMVISISIVNPNLIMHAF